MGLCSRAVELSVRGLWIALGWILLMVTGAAGTAGAVFECSVTIPNRSPLPPGGGSFTGLPPGETPPTHGNGKLWTVLTPDGLVVVDAD